MAKEKNKIDINKHEIDINTLKKQNVNDLLSIKELYKRLKELEEKISQIKYIDNTLVNKLKKEYLNLEKLILDENIQTKLTNDIKTINSQLTNDIKTINSQLTNDIKTINVKLTNVNEAINSELDNKVNKEELNSKIWTMTNMGQDVKKAMTGGSVAVVGENTILPINTVKKSLTAEEVDFLNVESKNLYNYKRVLSNKALNIKGEIIESEDKYTSELITAKNGDIICIKENDVNYNPYLLCFYGNDGFINYTASQFCTAPEGTTGFRFTTNGLKQLKVFIYEDGITSSNINEDYFETVYLKSNINVTEDSLPYTKEEIKNEVIEESKKTIITKDRCDFIKEIKSKNLCNISKLKNGFYLYKGVETAITDTKYYVTDYIPVTSGQSVSGNGGKQYVCLYDINKSYVSQNQTGKITATCDGYVRFTVYCTPEFRDNYLIITYGDYTADEVTNMYEPYYSKSILNDILISSDSIENLQNSRWKGKNLVVIGDSITECTGANEKLVLSYPYRLRDNLGFRSLKRCCYWGKHYYDFDEIVKHSVNITDGIEATITDGRIVEVKSFKEADLFLCFLGQNDTEHIGNIDDEKGQGKELGLIANIKYWIEYCLNENTGNPNAEFIFITPTPSLNQYLANLKANRQAIKDVAELYNVKCIDMFGLCGFNSLTQKTFYTTSSGVVTDSVHPTLENGHRRVYEVIRNGIGY